MDLNAKIVILITAVGVPALMIVLGWATKMAGYAANSSDMISDGEAWMLRGAIIYLGEAFIGALLYLYSKSQEGY